MASTREAARPLLGCVGEKMSHIVRMNRKPPQIEKAELKNVINKVSKDLAIYLESFIPKGGATSYTKHAIMGPVGKLLSALESDKFSTADGYVGYTVNIHENTGEMGPKKEYIDLLRGSVEQLLDIKNKVGLSRWPKIIREIDYSIYFLKMKIIQEKAKAKRLREKGGETP